MPGVLPCAEGRGVRLMNLYGYENTMKVRAHVLFYGRVQGVFFRANCQRKAVELGVAGWVRNLPDGSVEAVMEGEEGRVKELIQWCRHNQPYARVTDVRVEWEQPRGESGPFRVVR